MIKTRHLLATLVVFEAAIIGLLLASRYQVTLAPTRLRTASSRKRRRKPSRTSLRSVPKAPPRIASN
jgi:hypothetical protein